MILRGILKKCGGIFNIRGTFSRFFLLFICIAVVVFVEWDVAVVECFVADICVLLYSFVVAAFFVNFALHNASAVAAIGLNKGWLVGHAACCT